MEKTCRTCRRYRAEIENCEFILNTMSIRTKDGRTVPIFLEETHRCNKWEAGPAHLPTRIGATFDLTTMRRTINRLIDYLEQKESRS